MVKTSIIHDGDHGGDDFITTLMILGLSDHFELRGITTNFGNVPVGMAAQNALRALEMAGRPDVPVSIGAAQPFRAAPKEGDDAFGGDGLGGVNLPPPQGAPQDLPAQEWIIAELEATQAPITFCATGPATNMALMIRHIETNAPHLREKVGRIIMMGGGLAVGGNIKPYAEFNFYMDPEAADYVMKSGYDVVLHTLDTTHSLVFDPARQAVINEIAPHGSVLCKIMRAAEHLDMAHFGSAGSFVHDEQTVLYLLRPDLYESVPAQLGVKSEGEPGRLFKDSGNPHSVTLISRLSVPAAAFALIADSLNRLFSRSK